MNIRPRVALLVGVTLLVTQAGLRLSAGGGPQAPTPAPRLAATTAAVAPAAAARATLERYCLTCHTEQQRLRGTVPRAFDVSHLADVGAHAGEWEAIVRKVRAGTMPPAGMPRPDAVGREAFLGYLEGELDRVARLRPDPGRTEPLHRLNRTEYRNAVRDLLGVDADVASLLPPDDASYGFDNIAGVLKLSPTLVERYLVAARKISRLAVGTTPPVPTVDYFRVADDRSQEDRLPGEALGTRGGTTIRYQFPMDAQYAFRVELARDLNEQVPLYQEAHQLEVSIDGARVHLFTLPAVGGPAPEPAQEPGDAAADADQAAAAPRPRARTAIAAAPRLNRQGQEQRNRIDREWEVRVPVTAGAHDVQVAFLRNGSALAETARLPFLRPYPASVNVAEQRTGAYLRSVEISGPFDPSGPGRSAFRQQVFTCTPASATAAAERACAASIFGRLTRRAFRRPVSAEDLAPMLASYEAGRVDGGFDHGVEQGVMRLLVAPEFLMRVEADPPSAARGSIYRVSDLELASRLSFFLWSSIPDEELLRLAERGQLRQPRVLDAQVRRMVADPRFSAFVEGFAGQWLFLRNLSAVVPVQQNFPNFDDTLRQAFRTETELFFESIVREDRSAFDLLRARYTFVNERLAKHYGIPNVKGTRFRRVTLPDDGPRAGLLGQGSILTVTSYPDRTSPVVRGKWVLENLLGSPPPGPPPNVPPLAASTFADAPRSVRERMVQHRQNPVCASCHRLMDPIGLSLEEFDGVGQYRTREESGASIDASGSLPDGTTFTGAAGLTKALLGSDTFVRTLSEKLLTYALGRGLEPSDASVVRAMVTRAAPKDYRLSQLILEITRSAPFQMRRAAS
jgi:mono/diheme cytochrome c family protein